MKSKFLVLSLILLVSLGFVSASWWNPFSWFEDEVLMSPASCGDNDYGFWGDSLMFETKGCGDEKYSNLTVPHFDKNLGTNEPLWGDSETETITCCILFDSEGCEDKDGDGWVVCDKAGDKQDCNDNNEDVYPGAHEQCGDAIDYNCDEELIPESCCDNDGDYEVAGDWENPIDDCPGICGPNHNEACLGGNDCDDDPTGDKYPDYLKSIIDRDGDGNIGEHVGSFSETEYCDGIDNNCDGEIDNDVNVNGATCGGDSKCVLFGNIHSEEEVGSSRKIIRDVTFMPAGVEGGHAECLYTESLSQNLVGNYEDIINSQAYNCLPSEEYRILEDSEADLFGELYYSGSIIEQAVEDLIEAGDSWEWETACVARDKCADGYDNNGFQDVVKEYNLGAEGYVGEMFVKLIDGDDPSCKGKKSSDGEDYCEDEDRDGYCEDSPQFPDCDDDTSNDAEQYPANIQESYSGSFSTRNQCNNFCTSKCSGTNNPGIECKVIKNECTLYTGNEFSDGISMGSGEDSYFADCRIMKSGDGQATISYFEQKISIESGTSAFQRLKVFSKDVSRDVSGLLWGQVTQKTECGYFCDQVLDDLNRQEGVRVPETPIINVDNNGLCECTVIIQDTSNLIKGTIKIGAKEVHPFSGLVSLQMAGLPFACGSNYDVNCNKNGEDGYNMDVLLHGGTPFDKDSSTGVEYNEVGNYGVDLACQMESVGQVTANIIGTAAGQTALVVGTVGAVVFTGGAIATAMSPVAGNIVLALTVGFDIGSGVKDLYQGSASLVKGDYASATSQLGGGALWLIGARKNAKDIARIRRDISIWRRGRLEGPSVIDPLLERDAVSQRFQSKFEKEFFPGDIPTPRQDTALVDRVMDKIRLNEEMLSLNPDGMRLAQANLDNMKTVLRDKVLFPEEILLLEKLDSLGDRFRATYSEGILDIVDDSITSSYCSRSGDSMYVNLFGENVVLLDHVDTDLRAASTLFLFDHEVGHGVNGLLSLEGSTSRIAPGLDASRVLRKSPFLELYNEALAECFPKSLDTTSAMGTVKRYYRRDYMLSQELALTGDRVVELSDPEMFRFLHGLNQEVSHGTGSLKGKTFVSDISAEEVNFVMENYVENVQ